MLQKTLIVLIVLGASTIITQAQTDAHYWTHQYGAKGLLLNGAVIANPDDETAIYYNPACMGKGSNLGFAFSFLSPTYAYLRNTNLITDNTSLTDEDLGLSPGFASVRFRPFGTEKLTMAVASFERLKTDISFNDRIVDNIENNSFLLYTGDIEFSRKLSQHWLGVGFAYEISPVVTIGFSQFSIWHDESLQLDFKKEIASQVNPQNLFLTWRSKFNYNINAYAGFISKAGLAIDFEDLKLGFTYTSPAYGFAIKDASYAFDDFRINDEEVTHLSNQNDISLQAYKSPAAYGMGFEFKVDDLRVSVSTEYFRRIDRYTQFEDTDDPFDGLAAVDDPTEIRVTNASNNVVNFAIGFQRYVSPKQTWLWGFRTDFNQNSNFDFNGITEYLSSSPDIFHISGGGSFFNSKNQWSVGIDYGFGFKSGGMQLTDLSNINAENIFSVSGKDNVDTWYHQVMIFFTYDFLFGSVQEIE